MKVTQSPKLVRSVDRTLDILDLFLERPMALGVGEVSRLVGLPKSTVYRLLLTLEARHYLHRTGPDEKFELSPRVRSTPPRPEEASLRLVAQSVIEGLRDTCGDTVGLHVLDGDERICIAAAEGIRSVRTSGRVGSRAPLYTGASARAIMAFLSTDRWDEIIARTGLHPITPLTITNPELLKQELVRIRSEGHAVSNGEWDEGLTSAAAPIFTHGNVVVGSVNISGPSFRFSDEKIKLLVGALKAAAEVISQRLQAIAQKEESP